MEKLYDLVIIGSGPAGLGAAIYARRAMLDAVTIEKGLSLIHISSSLRERLFDE